VKAGAEENCLAHAITIAITSLNNDPNYTSYRKGCNIRPVVDRLLETTGINLKNGTGISELTKFQEYFHAYKGVVYSGLNCESFLFQRHSDTRINLLYDAVTQHYHVIANVTGAMAKRYVFED
jgi:hypothetical protein